MNLFDCGTRTFLGTSRHTQSTFEFFNRSAWPAVELARYTLELWFVRTPETKKKDIRRRFRGSNAEHNGAFLEIATGAILRAVGARVSDGPNIDGGTPDFEAVYRSVPIVVECTITQESDDELNNLQRTNVIKDAVDSICSGRFCLSFRVLASSSTSPPVGRLRRELQDWLAALDPDEEMIRLQKGYDRRSFVWNQDGWTVEFGAVPLTHVWANAGAIGMTMGKAFWGNDETKLRRTMEKKAKKYKSVGCPYLIVASMDTPGTSSDSILDALFGSVVETYVTDISSPEYAVRTECLRAFDGLLGSRSAPRKRNVSAVLYKPQLSISSLCSSVFTWELVHNPYAERPFPVGMFPFAREWTLNSGNSVSVKAEPTCTLNEVLGLCAPWPGPPG